MITKTLAEKSLGLKIYYSDDAGNLGWYRLDSIAETSPELILNVTWDDGMSDVIFGYVVLEEDEWFEKSEIASLFL